ncbi:hypothetical protein [Ahrensia sp. 13_GOM-1096m]|uniref:hypothetical protein n=1 Tax=Ahrensia sp. 13_GOM-1096m TaxID=1380380 RepID=UPI00047B64F9|nr:hypothetical protein [Ahrensia sp. 13_GOM-1096m]
MEFSRLSYEILRLQLGFTKHEDNQVADGSSAVMVDKRTKFGVRNLQRDQQSDSVRKLRLEKALNAFSDEVRNEANGLKNRLATDTNDAAFLMDAIDNDEASDAEMLRMSELESSVIYARERIRLLARQAGFFDDISNLAKMYPL